MVAAKLCQLPKEGKVIMKTIMAVLLLLVSTSLLAKPDCNQNPNFPACEHNPKGLTGGSIAAVPEPGSLALIGLGVAGLVVARKRKR